MAWGRPQFLYPSACQSTQVCGKSDLDSWNDFGLRLISGQGRINFQKARIVRIKPKSNHHFLCKEFTHLPWNDPYLQNALIDIEEFRAWHKICCFCWSVNLTRYADRGCGQSKLICLSIRIEMRIRVQQCTSACRQHSDSPKIITPKKIPPCRKAKGQNGMCMLVIFTCS